MPQVKIREDMDTLFEARTLSEEAKDKITTLFEAAIEIRANVVIAEAIVALETSTSRSSMKTWKSSSPRPIRPSPNISSTRSVAGSRTTSWELSTPSESSARKTSWTVSLDLLRESNISIPDESVDVIDEMTETVETLEGRVTDLIAENAKLVRDRPGSHRQGIVDELSEGLTMVDAEKLRPSSSPSTSPRKPTIPRRSGCFARSISRPPRGRKTRASRRSTKRTWLPSRSRFILTT